MAKRKLEVLPARMQSPASAERYQTGNELDRDRAQHKKYGGLAVGIAANNRRVAEDERRKADRKGKDIFLPFVGKRR